MECNKLCNQILSSVRIVVEHAIAGVKRCRIVKEMLRLTEDGIADLVMEIACGLHYFRVDCRQPIFDLNFLESFDST